MQIIGGVVLHEGKIAEMKTGEGKTLVATLPLYLNALTEVGAHLVTVNDYLARRDGGWMGKIYHALGLSVGVIGKERYSAIFDPDYVDPGGDLAIIRLTGKKRFPFAPLGDSGAVRVGDWAMAMGNPFLLAEDQKPTVTLGIVSGVERFQHGRGGGRPELAQGRVELSKLLKIMR